MARVSGSTSPYQPHVTEVSGKEPLPSQPTRKLSAVAAVGFAPSEPMPIPSKRQSLKNMLTKSISFGSSPKDGDSPRSPLSASNSTADVGETALGSRSMLQRSGSKSYTVLPDSQNE